MKSKIAFRSDKPHPTYAPLTIRKIYYFLVCKFVTVLVD